jgi:hypothetical protein
MTREIVLRLCDFVFGCHHRQLSRVFTIDCRTYRVCCACGATFKYSLETMSMDPRGSRSSALAELWMART